MNKAAFLIANLAIGTVQGDYKWLVEDGLPYEEVDPIDFLDSADIRTVFALYVAEYSPLDSQLNIPMPEGLLEFNRWVLFRDEADVVVGFAALKTSVVGLKLGLLATNREGASIAALKALLRRGLNVQGVYAEVSEGVERTVLNHVPFQTAEIAARVIARPVKVDPDGVHYTRLITNVGPKKKVLAGRPLEGDTLV